MSGLLASGFISISLIVLLCLSWPLDAAAQSQADEYQLKAAYLFHFAEFVQWPVDVRNVENTFLICIVGEDPFHGDLKKIVQGKVLVDKVVRVQHIKQLQDGRGCQVVFIDKEESKRSGLSMNSLHGLPVLTVGESDDFLNQGGMIRFTLEDRKIRFEINQQAAVEANLKVSSRLLLLAKTVVGDTSRK